MSLCALPRKLFIPVHLGERPAGELLLLDWSQAARDGDPAPTEVSLGSSEAKNAERAGLVVEDGWGGTELSVTEPC